MTRTDNTQQAKQQAEAQYQSIVEMVARLRQAEADNDDKAVEEAIQAIQEDPLSVEVRTGWYSYSTAQYVIEPQVEEYLILLCTGGPACKIVGNLSETGEPETARIEYQDWGTPWIEYPLTSTQEATVLEYARQFYFGE